MRLFIAEAASANRIALQMHLHRQSDIRVIGTASGVRGLSAQLMATMPEVLLLDWHIPGASRQDLFSDIRELEYPPKVVVLSIKAEEKGPALSAGADAFFDMHSSPNELLEVIRSVRETTVNSTE